MIETNARTAVADPLSESVRRLRGSMPAERIYLFGSRARGEATEESDFDFLVVVQDSPLPRYKREQQAFRALCDIGIAKDVLVFTRREFEKGLAVVTSLPATVAREGRLIYGG
ncbi:MAG: nucleotidyltransferase domain-containing protein [Candidatus Eisenbacteria bacterium]|nr:nucleotidyltransferase domain-containing protein [Candidatus Eisenbacteria bacterium]